MAAGGVVFLGGSVAAMSAMTPYGIAAGSTATAATAAIIIAPVLIAGGVMRGMDEAKVEREMIRRQSELPLLIPADENQFLHFFFPLAPSPSRFELTYTVSGEETVVILDICEPLSGLHIVEAPGNACEARMARP